MEDSVVFTNLSEPVWLKFEPVGSRFYQYVNSMVIGSALPESVTEKETSNSESDRDDDDDDENFEDINSLLLDPTQWKDQDHYAILGLTKLRYKATQKEIRKAYQQQALLHHPDKQETKEDTLFKCIQIAYEILGNPKRRRAFDSVDPTFNETIPPISTHSKENFYEVFEPVFQENSRWSTIQPVPPLGSPNSSLEEVEEFYHFWYDFNSWREFSFLDEENAEKAESREERRWMEKQNKAARQKRKKEEMSRIRTLVDNAYGCDPRIKFFKEKEKEEKEAQKRAKQEAAKEEALKKEMEKRQLEEEERRIREMKEEQERQEAAQQKQEREAQKKAIKKERKQLRSICKEREYFSSSDDVRIKIMQTVDYLCETLTIDSLQALNQKLPTLSEEGGRQVIEREMVALIEKEKEEREAAILAAKSKASSREMGVSWTKEEIQLLIKAVTMYPAGTIKRWEVIAQFVNTHSNEKRKEKTTVDIINKVKALRKLDTSDKEIENKQAFSNFEQKHPLKKGKGVVVTTTPTERDVADVPHPWTTEEQKLLEQALRTYPSTTPQRWDKIATAVKSRSKEECIARFKELVARVKSKKQ